MTNRYLAVSRRNRLRDFALHRNIDKRKCGPAQSFVFAEHKREISPNMSFGQRYSAEDFGLNVFDHMGAGDKPDPDISGDKSL